jgi:hypothetical protein
MAADGGDDVLVDDPPEVAEVDATRELSDRLTGLIPRRRLSLFPSQSPCRDWANWCTLVGDDVRGLATEIRSLNLPIDGDAIAEVGTW